MKDNSDRIIVEKIFQFSDLENKRILEVGCGNGRITALLAGRPKKLIGIEPDAEKVRWARKTVFGAEFLIGSGESLAFPDGCFDSVIFTLSLHHQNSSAAIREAIRVLKNEGEILVIEPVIEGEIERLFALVYNENQAKLRARQSIKESGLCVRHFERFNAEWIFEDKEELCQ